MMDFHAAFDALNHELFIEIAECDFKIIGNALNYIEVSIQYDGVELE